MLETPQIVKNGNQYIASYGDDRNIFVEFYEDAIQNKFASDESGITRYDDYILIKVITPGNKNTYIERIAHLDQERGEWVYLNQDNGAPTWQERFPKQWAQFQAKLEQTPNGFPVTECPFFTKAYALNLRANKIYTLEQIKDMPDTTIGILGLGARETREKVKTFLARGTDAAEITKLFAEVEKLKADNAVMKEQLADKGESPKVESPRAKKLNIA